MKGIQDENEYLGDVDNIFHQLRGHYLRLNKMLHPDFKFGVEEEVKIGVDRKPMEVSILEARIQKMRYFKMRRKGENLVEDEESSRNLQLGGPTKYYSLDEIMSKLSENEVDKDNKKKEKGWRQLTEEEQLEKLKEFTEKFKDKMDIEIWKELKKELVKKYKEEFFDKKNLINWHKGSQKIMEIKDLVINPACFYWVETE